MSKDLFHKLIEDKGPIGNWQDKAEGYFTYPKLEGKEYNRMSFNDKKVINWSINDYLGLANHSESRKVELETVTDYSCAYPMGSRMLTGHTKYHEELEVKLASFVKKEKAFLGNFGYQMIMSCIDSLINKNDVIIYDAHCHACIIDGVRLHVGKRLKFAHNNVEKLKEQLIRASKITSKTNGGILVISEGVFGMQGQQGKLSEITDLKKEFDFRLMVDDAHGFGTLGKDGSGTGSHQKVQEKIDVYISTFSKSMASIGAFIASESEVIDYLKYNMRSQVFAKSLPLIHVIGVLKKLEILKNDSSLRTKLWKNVKKLQCGLKGLGYDVGKTNSCITPVYIKGNIQHALKLVQLLREKYKIFCSIVVYPVIPKDMILLRLIPTATHTKQDIEETLNAFSEIKKTLL